VWSRCDGATSAREIILMLGLGTDKAIEILRRLRSAGALLFDGETAADLAKANRAKAAPREDRTPAPEDIALDVSDLGELTAEEQVAMDHELGPSLEERLQVIAAMRSVKNGDYFEMLCVPADADRKSIKRAYFRMSKAFHPDRYYGRDLGPCGPWYKVVFEAITEAFQILGNPRSRKQYEARQSGARVEPSTQSRDEHARELFERACDLEVSGESEQALKLFAAAIRGKEEPRFLRRAAMCAKSVNQLSTAEEYAKKAADLRPRDPSYLRVVADVYRAGGRLSDARAILLQALDLKTENDALVGELAADLEAVEKAIAADA